MTPDRRPTHALVASAVLAVAVAAAGTAMAYAVRDRLPDQLAVHWGVDGQPDRFATFTEAVTTAAVLTVTVPLLLVALGALMHRSARGPVAAIAGGLAVFLGGLLFGGLLAQRPGQSPQAFPPQWAVPTLVLTGAEDHICPRPLQEELAAGIPGARHAVVEGAGHMAALDRPEDVAAHLKTWLEENP